MHRISRKPAGYPVFSVESLASVWYPNYLLPVKTPMNLCRMFTGVLLCGALFGQAAAPASPQSKSSTASDSELKSATSTGHHSTMAHPRYRPERFAGRAGTYYRLVWGIDSLSVKSAEAGEVIRFSYEVLDASKAKVLNDKRIEPSLIDEDAHVKLVVPLMDKVGKLRQSTPPESGKTYWMLFSNKGGYVKRGDKVNIVIGDFRADALTVD